MNMGLNELTIKQAADGLRKKEFSVTELVSDCLKTVREKDKEIHAYLEVFEDALVEAKKLDILISQNFDLAKLPPLWGIPLAIKDNILVAGKRCTAGSKILENYVASYDATVIQKLKKQGAIILGKTNLDEFAMGSSTENSAFGPTKNPHDVKRVPGGSSGGSAAAVAAHMCIAALGSDTGGSIRQPASFCGLAGFKPTYGKVSRHGLIAMASSLDQIGPLAKTVEDAKILWEAVTGGDEFDATSVKETFSPPRRNLPPTTVSDLQLKNLKIGVPKEYFGQGLSPEVEKTIKGALKKLEQNGAILKEISLPHSIYALPAYYIIVPSEVSANLARFDGIRYGFALGANEHASTESRISVENLYDAYAQTRAGGFGPEVKRRIMLGTYALSAGYYDAYYLKAQRVRSLISADFETAFQAVEVIVGPTTPTSAFEFGERTKDPLQMYLADIYTVAVNLAGVPALSVNAGWVEKDGSKLPVGLQLIGKRGGDEDLLNIGLAVEKLISY